MARRTETPVRRKYKSRSCPSASITSPSISRPTSRTTIPAWTAQDGESAPHAARLPAAHQRGQLQVFDREARHSPLIFLARGIIPRVYVSGCDDAFAIWSARRQAPRTFTVADEKVRPFDRARFETP